MCVRAEGALKMFIQVRAYNTFLVQTCAARPPVHFSFFTINQYKFSKKNNNNNNL